MNSGSSQASALIISALEGHVFFSSSKLSSQPQGVHQV